MSNWVRTIDRSRAYLSLKSNLNLEFCTFTSCLNCLTCTLHTLAYLYFAQNKRIFMISTCSRPTDRRTDSRTVTHSYRDARTHLKRRQKWLKGKFGRSFGRRSAVFGEGGRKAKRWGKKKGRKKEGRRAMKDLTHRYRISQNFISKNSWNVLFKIRWTPWKSVTCLSMWTR